MGAWAALPGFVAVTFLAAVLGILFPPGTWYAQLAKPSWNPGLGAAIALTVRTFWPVDRLAAALLGPYLAWVSFAAVLNFTLWRLNS